MPEKLRHETLERLLMAAAKQNIHGPSALAKALNESDQVVTNWGRRGISRPGAMKAEQLLGISSVWVLTGDGAEPGPTSAPEPRELNPPSVAGISDGDFVAIRRADVSFSNGHGQVVYSEDDRPPLVFRADFLRRMGIAQGNAVVVEAEGTSNEPKIPDGAVVLINRGDRERLNGDLFAFRVDGELLIKRLSYIEDIGILATAENPNFKPKQVIYRNPPDFEVIGRAVWTGALL